MRWAWRLLGTFYLVMAGLAGGFTLMSGLPGYQIFAITFCVIATAIAGWQMVFRNSYPYDRS